MSVMKPAVRRTVVLVGVVVAAAATVGIFSGAVIGRASSVGPPDWLIALAQQQAVAAGDATPSSGEFVASTRQAADSVLSGETVDSDGPVYLVVMQGTFQSGSYGPLGSTAATGSVYYFVADSNTHEVLDTGIMNATPSLDSLGTVGQLPS